MEPHRLGCGISGDASLGPIGPGSASEQTPCHIDQTCSQEACRRRPPEYARPRSVCISELAAGIPDRVRLAIRSSNAVARPVPPAAAPDGPPYSTSCKSFAEDGLEFRRPSQEWRGTLAGRIRGPACVGGPQSSASLHRHVGSKAVSQNIFCSIGKVVARFSLNGQGSKRGQRHTRTQRRPTVKISLRGERHPSGFFSFRPPPA
jgi:hypothetical protein